MKINEYQNWGSFRVRRSARSSWEFHVLPTLAIYYDNNYGQVFIDFTFAWLLFSYTRYFLKIRRIKK